MKRTGYQLRLSAISGFQSALVIMFVTLGTISIRAIVDWIFNRRINEDWQTSLIVGSSIAFVWYLGVCASTFIDIRRATIRGHDFRQSFPASALIAGIYGIGGLFSAVLMVGLYREHDPLWMQMEPLVMTLVAYYGWPRTIHCGSEGIWQRTRLGMKRYIPYTDVIAISSSDGTTTVTGERASIEHTPYHAAGEQFLNLVAQRTGKEIY